MKKTIIIGLVIALALLTACEGTATTVHQITADRLDLAETVTELQEVSDLIVVFTPQNQENITDHYPDGNVSAGYTKTTGTVEKVLFGNTTEGDSICITEECYTTDLGTTLWTQGGYLPMETGKQYLLFLKAYDIGSAYEGMYFPVDLEYGKYVVPMNISTFTNDSIAYTAADLQVGEAADLDTYTQWYEEVFALYPNLMES